MIKKILSLVPSPPIAPPPSINIETDAYFEGKIGEKLRPAEKQRLLHKTLKDLLEEHLLAGKSSRVTIKGRDFTFTGEVSLGEKEPDYNGEFANKGLVQKFQGSLSENDNGRLAFWSGKETRRVPMDMDPNVVLEAHYRWANGNCSDYSDKKQPPKSTSGVLLKIWVNFLDKFIR
jgi:hypothetical protein